MRCPVVVAPVKHADGDAQGTPEAAGTQPGPWERAAAWAGRWPAASAVAVFALYKAAVLLVAYHLLDAPAPGTTPRGYLRELSLRWDGIHYLNIARHGYVPDAAPGLDEPFAFPPLFPWLIRVAGAHDLAPLVVSNLLSLAAVAVVARLMGLRAALFFALFPTWAAFSSFGYTESLFVLLAALALLLLHRQSWTLAGLLTGLAVLSRYGSVVPFLAVFHPLLRQPRRAWLEFLLPAGACAVLLAAFFYFRAGSLLAYWSAQEPWGGGTIWPWQQAEFYLEGWFAQGWPTIHPSHWLLRNYAFLTVSALGAYHLLRGPYDRTWGLFGLFTAVFVLTLSGTPAISMPRLLVMGFPAIAVLGDRLRGPGSWLGYGAFAFLGACWVVVSHMTSFFA